MKKLVLVFVSVLFTSLVIPKTYATNTPKIQNPSDNSTITDSSPKLEWEYSDDCPQEGNCFRVEVSKSESFSELEKSIYTNNKYYTPSLSEAKWYWRVKAKDAENNWSSYINASFTISPSNNATQSPSSTPSSLPSPNSSEKTTSEFIISSNTIQFTSDTTAKIDIKISGLQPNTNYYLKAAFFKEGKTNYFGKTKIENSWIKNNATYSDQYKLTSNPDKSWQGNLEIQIDTEDSGFEGSGEYLLKVGRYNAVGTGPTWSNAIPVTINAEKPSDKKEPSTENTIEKKNSTEDISETTRPSEEIENNTSNEPNPSPEENITYSLPNLESSVAGESTSSGQTKVLGQKKINWWFVTSGFLFLILTAILIVNIHKKRYYQ